LIQKNWSRMPRCACSKATRSFELASAKASSKLIAANSSKKKKWMCASSECSSRDASPLDASRRGQP
jgi:hypothetical protein